MPIVRLCGSVEETLVTHSELKDSDIQKNQLWVKPPGDMVFASRCLQGEQMMSKRTCIFKQLTNRASSLTESTVKVTVST